MTSPQPPHDTSDNRSELDEAFASSLRFVAGRMIQTNRALAVEIVRQMGFHFEFPDPARSVQLIKLHPGVGALGPVHPGQ